jgi:hypothetical protein
MAPEAGIRLHTTGRKKCGDWGEENCHAAMPKSAPNIQTWEKAAPPYTGKGEYRACFESDKLSSVIPKAPLFSTVIQRLSTSGSAICNITLS